MVAPEQAGARGARGAGLTEDASENIANVETFDDLIRGQKSMVRGEEAREGRPVGVTWRGGAVRDGEVGEFVSGSELHGGVRKGGIEMVERGCWLDGMEGMARCMITQDLRDCAPTVRFCASWTT